MGADDDDRLLSLPFDHYERYSITAEILSILKADLQMPLRVLDVGGYLSSLKHFRPEDQIVLVDPKEPPTRTHVQGLPFLFDHYVRSLGGGLPFSDAAFDVVTAHDTLEHVPEAHRAAFLKDLFRSASRFVIVNGPVSHPEVNRAEHRLAIFWEKALGWDSHPLDEHLAHGLPEREVMERAFEEADMPYVALPNGNVRVWLTMMAIEGYLLSLPNSENLQSTVERVFNRMVAPEDFGGVCYRTAFVAARRPEDAEALRRVEQAFRLRLRRLPSSDDLSFLNQVIDGLEDHAVRVRGYVHSLTSEVSRAQNERLEREASVRTTMEVLARNEERLDRAETDLRTKTTELRDATARLQTLTRERDDVRVELENIRASAAYRVARKIRRWFPRGTIRGWFLSRIGRLARRGIDRRRGKPSDPPGPEDTPVVSGVARTTPAVYQRWIDRQERSRQELEAERPRLAVLPYQPLISIVVPTWNPVPGQLNHTLESITEQIYGRWELCIADGHSSMEVRRLLSRFKDSDERVRVRFLEENLGISGNTMEALDMATGEFVAFVDQSDVLAPDALALVAETLNRNPSLDVIYSDWDLLSEDGRARFNPYFTPEWSPDLLLSANYMTHLSVIRRRLVEEVGGLRSELDGAQDWDLILRVTERTDRIARIPDILYHWRADPSSAALTLHPKPAAEAAQRRAVQEHLDRRGSSGSVVRTPEGHLRIGWALGARPTVSIIIPTRHNRELLERCLAGIHRSSYPEREVIVVETAGRTAERETWYRTMEDRFPLTVLWWDQPFNYSAVNNFAANQASGDVLLFLNDDTEPLTDDWIEEIVGWLQQEGVGAVGAQLLAEDGSIQHGGVVLGMQGFAEHLFRGLEPDSWTILGSSAWYRDVSAVTGACLGISKSLFQRIGGWDERFELCGSDVELCLRVRREGLRVVVDPYARLRHIERATRGTTIPQGDFCLSLWHYQRHLYGGDPFFSPNLSYQDPVPRLLGPDEPSSLGIVSDVIGRDVAPRPPGDDQRDAPILVEALKVDPSDVEAIHRSHAATTGRRELGSVTWFIPDFENPYYGGIHTIFRFADRLHRAHGVTSRFAVTGTGPEEFIRSGLRVTFPAIADADIFMIPGGSDEDLERLPSSDAAVCTLWVTAFPMARWRGADRYFSFVQDFEPMFYPAGALYALAEETYRMGFFGIANTPPLKEIYESYGGTAASFTPSIDPEVFHPRDSEGPQDGPFTVFMYARPGHPRNCYELAVAALRRLKDSMGEQVRVVTAGSWTGGQTEPWLDQLGFLDYRETGDLYRRCDAGLVLSVSKHPTYIPLQLMACGALVVANDNPANGWLLRDGENALLADPTPDALAAALQRGLSDRELRARLTKQSAIDIGDRHSDWGSEIDRIYRFMCDPGGPSSAYSG